MATPDIGKNDIPEFISIGIVASVLACHEIASNTWILSPAGVRRPNGDLSHTAATEEDHQGRSWMALDVNESGLRDHINNLLERTLERRVQYLADAGLDDNQIEDLVALVEKWLDDNEISRLDSLSRSVTPGSESARDLFLKWIDGQSLFRLAILLHCSGIEDHQLAAAYAMADVTTITVVSYLPHAAALLAAGQDDC